MMAWLIKKSMDQWFEFFNSRSLEVLNRKQRKTQVVDIQIEELKSKLEPHRESAEFKKLALQLNKDLIAKDLEVQQRKMKKYQRDVTDYKAG